MSHHKGKNLDLHQQMYNRLKSMCAFGESKKNAKKNGSDQEKIFSFSTYKTYYRHCNYFIKWLHEAHPTCTKLKSAQAFVPEWLESRSKTESISAWTLHLEAKALGKLFGISPGDKDYWVPPQRRREDIKRSRTDCVRDRNFSKTNNKELIEFAEGTGLRRRELSELRGKDILTKEQIEGELSYLQSIPESVRTQADSSRISILLDTRRFTETAYIHVRNGKGGRERISPIIGPHSEEIIARITETPAEQKVWSHIPSHADIHGYRAVYATSLYRSVARPIDDIPYDRINIGSGRSYQSEVYHCRRDERGRKLDKKAMKICAIALGHNRISIIAENYLRGL